MAGTSIVNGAPAMSINDIDMDILRIADIFCVNEVEVGYFNLIHF